MRIIPDKKEPDRFKVESSSKKGNFYHVNVVQPFCDCPNFMFREIKVHGECKHIKAVKEYIEKHKKKGLEKYADRYEQIISFVKDKKEVDSVELIEKFSEQEVNELIKKGELLEQRNVIRLLR